MGLTIALLLVLVGCFVAIGYRWGRTDGFNAGIEAERRARECHPAYWTEGR